MYGTQQSSGAAESLLSGVAIDPIPERLGQLFRINLEKQLNPGGRVPPNPTYRLQVSLAHTEAGIGVARDGTVSRYNIYLDSRYNLYRLSDGQKMASGRLRHVSSYNNILNEYFSTYVSQEDALKRGVAELSQIYRQRLSVYLSSNDGKPVIQEEKEEDQTPFDPITPLAPGGQNSLEPNYPDGYGL